MKTDYDTKDLDQHLLYSFWAVIVCTIIALSWLVGAAEAQGIPFTDNNCIRAAVGEASGEGYQGLLAVCCGIRNRGTLSGVYGYRAKHVDGEPDWVWELARKAWADSALNRIHNGDHWENVKEFGTPYWVKDMVKVYEYKSHVFYNKGGVK